MAAGGIQPTYEELKQGPVLLDEPGKMSIQPTYEELKPAIAGRLRNRCLVSSLPMRN